MSHVRRRVVAMPVGRPHHCRITSECWVGAIDPDGPGGNPPIIITECAYNCVVDYCVWV